MVLRKIRIVGEIKRVHPKIRTTPSPRPSAHHAQIITPGASFRPKHHHMLTI